MLILQPRFEMKPKTSALLYQRKKKKKLWLVQLVCDLKVGHLWVEKKWQHERGECIRTV